MQIEYSLISRGVEAEILPTCRELGVGVTAYGVLSRGLLSGHWSKEREASLAPHDFRASAPRFTGENLERNLALVETLRSDRGGEWSDGRSARDRLGAVPRRRRRAARWRAHGVSGSPRRSAPARSNSRETTWCGSKRAVPVEAVAGERYHAEQMAILDSERD